MATNPTISVLIRTIGRKEALKDALASLRQQTFKNFETIVVEDGPATLALFLGGYPDLNIHYEALGVRQGRSTAGNKAMDMAQGSFFIFLDEDDTFGPHHLEYLLQKTQTDNYRIVYSWSHEQKVDRAEDGKIIRTGRFTRTHREPFSLRHMIVGNFIPINAVLFHRSLYEAAGGFDTDVDLLEDWLLWLRYVAVEPNWGCVPHVTAFYGVPMNRSARRREFHAVQGVIRERMEKIKGNWDLSTLQQDIKNYFGLPIFLRRVYYYLTSYI